MTVRVKHVFARYSHVDGGQPMFYFGFVSGIRTRSMWLTTKQATSFSRTMLSRQWPVRVFSLGVG